LPTGPTLHPTMPPANAEENGRRLAAVADAEGIEAFLVSYLDLFGVQRAKLVPASAIATVATNGAGFAGFAAHFDMTPAHADLLAFPDPDSLVRLPWKPEVGWLASDLWLDDQPFAQCPRQALSRQLAAAEKMGFSSFKTGVEVEFMLIEPSGAIDARDSAKKPCYEVGALMRRYDVLKQLLGYCEALGWGPYQCDHEDANGQFELNFEYAGALITADRIAFHKLMIRSVAEEHGLRATFMPKPFADKTGNGMHVHFTLHAQPTAGGKERNVFAAAAGEEGDEYGLSRTARHFLGGVLSHVTALSAIANPTVNSYKRLGASAPDSGATWAPTVASHGGNDRTHVVRVPDAPRYELRLADMAAHPYLLPAALLAAGLDGLTRAAEPPPRAKVAAWDLKASDAEQLPSNLLEALSAFKADNVLRETLGAEVCSALHKLRLAQWREYSMHLTQWELDTGLDA